MFNFIAFLFRRERRTPPTLGFWKLSPPDDFLLFLRSLHEVMPHGSVLVISGRGATEDDTRFLESISIIPGLNISSGSIWPRSISYHVPLIRENTHKFAGLLASHPTTEIPTHVYVYHNETIMLRWNDAPLDPLFISKAMPAHDLERLCSRLGCHLSEKVQ